MTMAARPEDAAAAQRRSSPRLKGDKGTGWTPRARTTHRTPLPGRPEERTDPTPRCHAPRHRPPRR
ncbi:hypothetical protein, partial [Streptomyces sioyaensis]|uniref:hypothetical protein n=1 Tax=Streptomyces sioyaensis TaxID=67364 RepID=UPI001C2C8309